MKHVIHMGPGRVTDRIEPDHQRYVVGCDLLIEFYQCGLSDSVSGYPGLQSTPNCFANVQPYL